MQSSQEQDALQTLFTLNYQFGQAEKEAEQPETRETSQEFFQRHLHEELMFRRAGGSVAKKQDYLNDLAAEGNQTTELTSSILEIAVAEDGQTAEALVLVNLMGTRKHNPANGLYRNRRLFVKQANGDWQCLMWFNTRVGAR